MAQKMFYKTTNFTNLTIFFLSYSPNFAWPR